MEVQIPGTEDIKTRHTSAQSGPWSMIKSPKLDTQAFINNSRSESKAAEH